MGARLGLIRLGPVPGRDGPIIYIYIYIKRERGRERERVTFDATLSNVIPLYIF